MQDESIINIVQKMVQEGQSREKIVQTLKDLGVDEDQAKKLLLIAEADTFTLLKKEIRSVVSEEFANQKENFENIIHSDLAKVEQEEKSSVKEIAIQQLGDVKKDFDSEVRAFEDRVNKTIMSSQKTVSLVKVALDSINERMAQSELDIEQMKVHKFRKHSMVFSYIMLAMGLVLLITGIALFILKFNEIDTAQITMIGIMIVASITLMFASVIS
jgi:hypothetical protein